MKKSILLCVICFWNLGIGFAQPTVLVRQSLGIEYGFVDIPADDMVGQMMFAKQRSYVYGDDQYTMMRKIATGEGKTLDAIPLEMITNLASGESWFCVTLGDTKLRTNEAAPNLAQSMGFNDIQESAYSFSKNAVDVTAIQGYACENWKFDSEELMPLSFYVTRVMGPVELLEKWPFYLKKDAENMGICLGSDKTMGKTYQMRALKIDIDQKLDLATYLQGFKLSSNEEINKVMKKYLGF